MPLASFHYVFESQQEFMRELVERVIADAGDSQRFPVLTEDIYRNVELMLLSTFEWAVEHPDEDLAYYELLNYALRTPGMEDFGQRRLELSLELIVRAFQILDAIHENQITVADVRDLAWLVLTFIEGNAVMHLHTKETETIRRAIHTFAILIVDFARGRNGDRV